MRTISAMVLLVGCLTAVIAAKQPPANDNEKALALLRERLSGHENEPAEAFFTNVTILKGRPAGRLPGMMAALTGLIGVDCTYCHVQGNWSSDDKPAKRTARAHFAMIARINREDFGGENKVSCWSCHRGKPTVPLTGDASPADAARSAAFAAIIVPNAEDTAAWYETKLGFRVTARSTAPSGIARNVTVESPLGMIEIIQHDQSIDLAAVLPNQQQRRLVRGISKVGFFVTGIETLERDLRDRGVEFVSPLFTDDTLRLKSFIVHDNAGNYVQFMERTGG